MFSVLIGYVVVSALAYMGQSFVQYTPTHRDLKGRGDKVLLPWRADDGAFLGYVRDAEHPKRVVVFFHGNGGEALNWAWYTRIVPSDQILVLAEYPGYGAKSGTPSQREIFKAADILVKEVIARWSVPITLVGESLGTGVACYVAAKHAVDRLALVSPFTSVMDVASHLVPFLPVSVMLKDPFPSDEYVATVTIPLHIVHGSEDSIVPIALGRRLFSLYPGSKKTFTELTGFDHLSVNRAITRSPMAAAFRDFLIGIDQLEKEPAAAVITTKPLL